MGANAGEPNNKEQQHAIVKETLQLLETIETPGRIVKLNHEYHASI
jgi:D-proline reductase (dithiol) PrdB